MHLLLYNNPPLHFLDVSESTQASRINIIVSLLEFNIFRKSEEDNRRRQCCKGIVDGPSFISADAVHA